MSNLTLDGSTSFIGTEFIKLLATGSSDLATVQYVDDAIAQGGGGGAIDAYTKTEVDNLLSSKLNVNNPQDVLGTLRIDSTNGNGKLIVNAVGAPNDEDFYVNGLSNLGGTLKCQLLQASSNIETSQLIKSNTLNTYANVDMTIQRNSIDYIVLESDKVNFKRDIYVNDVLLTGGGSGNPFDENVVINNPYELQCNTFNNSVLNQDMVFNLNGGEWFRLQFSDNTVRVPNTKSFLSQNIYTDIIRPIAFGNDMICYGSNAADSGYVEYWKLNHAAETIDFSKVIRCNELNTLTDTDLIIKRYGVEKMSVNSTYVQFSGGVYCGNKLVVDTAGLLTLAPYASGGYNYFDIRNNHGTNPMIRFRCSVSGETVCMEITPSYVNFKKDITIENTVRLKTNTIDTNGDNDLVFQRDNVQFLALDKFTENTVEREAIICRKQLRANGNILVNNLQINQFPVGIEYCDFRLEDADSVMRFYAGNSTSVNLQITNAGLTLGRLASCTAGLKTNSIDTYTDTDLIFRRNGTEFFRLKTTNIIEVADTVFIYTPRVYTDLIACKTLGTDTVFYGSNTASNQAVEYFRFNYLSESVDFVKPIKTNTVNSNGDNDLVFQRNGTEIVKFNSSNEAEFSQDIKLNTIGKFVKWTNCFIREGITTTRPDFDICMNDATGHMRFYVGSISDTSNIKFALVNNRVSCKVDLQAEDGITVFNGKELKTNTVNSNGNIDVSFQRNSVEFFKFQSSVGVDNNDIINVAEGKGISAQHVYGNLFKSRSLGYDTLHQAPSQ